MLASLRPKYEVERPAPERIGGQRYDGTDWIVRADDQRAFIECKAKRMSLAGAVAENLPDLESQLAILADAIVQNYKNIHRAMERMKTNGDQYSRFYCVVITLEDWFLFSEITATMLHDQVIAKLAAAGLTPSLMDEVPYRVLSFEGTMICCACLLESTMDDVLGLTNDHTSSGMGFVNALSDRFPHAAPHEIGDFESDFARLLDPILTAANRATASS